jgi:putative ABC transport system permease protein
MDLNLGFSIALRALARNRLQTVLTMLGMTIGVGAVVTTTALGRGAQSSIEQQVMAAGLNVIVITAGNYKAATQDDGGGVVDHQARWEAQGDQGDQGDESQRDPEDPREIVNALLSPDLSEVPDLPVRISHPEDDPMEKHNHPTARQRLGDAAAGLGASATLSSADADAIRDEVGGVQYVASGVHENARVVVGDKRWFTRLHGTDVEIPQIRRAWTFVYGDFFSAGQQRQAEQVVVLGTVVSEKVFGAGVNPVGREVRIWNQPFEVVGVIASTSWTATPTPGDDHFDAVYTPYTTVHRLLNLTKLNTITVTVRNSGEVSRVARQVTELLRKRHAIADARPDDFTVRTQAREVLTKGLHPSVARAIGGNVFNFEQVTLEQLARTLERASWTMTLLLASIAAVSLIVGGIGIMNIMLLAVTERTREVGLRMAVGARAKDVLLQFLAEAVTLSLIGGLLGVVVGIVAAGGLRQFLRFSTELSLAGILLAFAIAAATGVFFGYYPAKRASKLEPIDALRFE